MQDLLTIGELATRSGVAPSALRYYERLGLIHSTRTSGNQRRYERSQLRRVAFVRIAAQVGIPLDRIRAALAGLPDQRTPTKADWARLSRTWRAELDDRIATLERLRDKLTGCIGCGCLSLRTCALSNPGDELAERGPGPRYLLPSGTGPHPGTRPRPGAQRDGAAPRGGAGSEHAAPRGGAEPDGVAPRASAVTG